VGGVTPKLATLLNVIMLQRQRKSMRPTENEAGMKQTVSE
jgi:hypothetical protein